MLMMVQHITAVLELTQRLVEQPRLIIAYHALLDSSVLRLPLTTQPTSVRLATTAQKVARLAKKLLALLAPTQLTLD
jgi:hypothetical protein